MKNVITVGGRGSPLSRAQVQEVLEELRVHHPEIIFRTIFIETHGDKDRTTSLRTLDKTDFFTKEIDELLLSGKCQIGIHSAKDLPDPLPKGIVMVALTLGIDSSDSLVLREGESLEMLPKGAVIATSSQRREEAVSRLKNDLQFIDIRGKIGERLEILNDRKADGVVIAEAALIRLKLTHLNRIRIPGNTVPFQGQLAILARDNDPAMKQLFSFLDTRTKTQTT